MKPGDGSLLAVFEHGDGRTPCPTRIYGAIERADTWRTAIVIMHPSSNFMAH